MPAMYLFSFERGRIVSSTAPGAGPDYPYLVLLSRDDTAGVPFLHAKNGCLRALEREVRRHEDETPEAISLRGKIGRLRRLVSPPDLPDLSTIQV